MYPNDITMTSIRARETPRRRPRPPSRARVSTLTRLQSEPRELECEHRARAPRPIDSLASTFFPTGAAVERALERLVDATKEVRRGIGQPLDRSTFSSLTVLALGVSARDGVDGRGET